MIRPLLEMVSRKMPWYDPRSTEEILAEARREHVELLSILDRIEDLEARIDAQRSSIDELKAFRVREKQERNAMRQAHSYFVYALLPAEIARDFLANLNIIFIENWVPRFGQRRARFLWHRNCWGMVIRYWFDVLVSAAERVRKVIY